MITISTKNNKISSTTLNGFKDKKKSFNVRRRSVSTRRIRKPVRKPEPNVLLIKKLKKRLLKMKRTANQK